MKGYDLTPPKSPRFTSVHQVCDAAKQSYCWIFHKTSRRWWTPDEFMDEYFEKDFSSMTMLNFIENLSIRDPRSGISAAFKQVGELEDQHKKETSELISRIEVFNKKVITYYQEKSKPKLRKQDNG